VTVLVVTAEVVLSLQMTLMAESFVIGRLPSATAAATEDVPPSGLVSVNLVMLNDRLALTVRQGRRRVGVGKVFLILNK
jgi:hypothetical protein